MSNPYFRPGAQRAARVNDLFGAIASRYDLLNDLQCFGMHRFWKRRLVRISGARPGVQALDLCCGTGDIAQALERAGAAVTGLDFSGPMLEVAARRFARARKESATTSSLVRGDAQALPFADGQFDVVTVGYGLRNLASFERGLAEMRRVARPGGRLLVLDFGKPANRLWREIYFGYLGVMVPLFGRLFARNAAAYAYILESLKHYPAQAGVAKTMRELGCANVRIHNFFGGAMSINYGEKG